MITLMFECDGCSASTETNSNPLYIHAVDLESELELVGDGWRINEAADVLCPRCAAEWDAERAAEEDEDDEDDATSAAAVTP